MLVTPKTTYGACYINLVGHLKNWISWNFFLFFFSNLQNLQKTKNSLHISVTSKRKKCFQLLMLPCTSGNNETLLLQVRCHASQVGWGKIQGEKREMRDCATKTWLVSSGSFLEGVNFTSAYLIANRCWSFELIETSPKVPTRRPTFLFLCRFWRGFVLDELGAPRAVVAWRGTSILVESIMNSWILYYSKWRFASVNGLRRCVSGFLYFLWF